MKTTIEIPDELFSEASQVASDRGVTFRALVESALRDVVSAGRRQPGPFRLRKHPFGGEGLQPDLQDAPWSEIRRHAYEGRGG
jgi:hypothetical protein